MSARERWSRRFARALPAFLRRHTAFGHISAIAQGSALLVLARVIGMLAGLVLMILLARTLSPQEFGIVTLGFSIALIGGLLTTLNIGAGSIRFLTGFVAADKRQSAATYIGTGRRVLVVAALIVWLGVAAIEGAAYAGMLRPLPVYLVAGLAAAPVFGWLRIHAAYVASLGAVVRAAVPGTLLRPLLMLGFVALVLLFGRGIDAPLVLGIYVACVVIVAAVQQALFRPTLGPVTLHPFVPEASERRRWIGVGFGLLIPTLFLELSVETVIVIASLVLSAEKIAVLGVVLRIQAIILFGVTSVNMVVGPRIAGAHARGDRNTVNDLVVVSAHLKLWPSLITLALLALFGRRVLGIFGPEYQTQLVPLLLVSLSPLVMAVFGPVVLFMTVLGLQKQGNRVFVSAIALLVVSILTMGSLFGVAGVAGAVVAVWLFWHYRLYRLILEHGGYDTLQPKFGLR